MLGVMSLRLRPARVHGVGEADVFAEADDLAVATGRPEPSLAFGQASEVDSWSRAVSDFPATPSDQITVDRPDATDAILMGRGYGVLTALL